MSVAALAGGGAAPRVVGLEERLEHLALQRLRDADAVVDDVDPAVAAEADHADHHHRPARLGRVAVLDGVRQQVAQHPAQQLAVAAHG
jgi:hypothetical protein